MTDRLIAVGDDFTLPAAVKITDANLPDASKAENITEALAFKLDAAEKGVAGGVATLGDDSRVPDTELPTRLQDAALDGRYVRKGGQVINVKDYGAVGDGVADETNAVQQALGDLAAAGGGTLIFPPGTYWWPSPHTAQIKSNITIQGDGATLIKRFASDSTMFFCIKSNGATGYGSGAKNVTFVGLNLRGDFANGRTAGLLGANHGSNILVDRCVFDQCLGKGHILDLGGCEDVVVRNCVFRGSNYPAPEDRYNECIQADNSTYIGSSAPDDAGSYDGLASRNFLIENCRFLPLTVGGVTYPAPVPFGTHFSVTDQYHTNLQFLNNIVDTPSEDTASTYRGLLHFVGAKGIRIRGNRFINRTGAAVSAVRTIVISTSFPATDAGLASPVSATLATPIVCSDIEVSGNTFIGFNTTTSTTSSVVVVYGDQATGNNVQGVKINDNRFEGCYVDYTQNVGPSLIEVIDVADVEIARNRMDGGRRLVYFQDADRIGIRGNEINKTSSGVAVNGFRSTLIDFSHNKINDYAGGFLIAGGLGVNVNNNQFRGERTGSFTTINIGGTSQRFIVTGNDVLTTVTSSKPVLVQQTSTVGIVRSNILTGATVAVTVNADSTATVDGNL